MDMFEFLDTEIDRLLNAIAAHSQCVASNSTQTRSLLEDLAALSLSVEDVLYGAYVEVGLDINVQILMAHAFLNQCISRATRDAQTDARALANLDTRLKAYVTHLREDFYPIARASMSAKEQVLVTQEIRRRLSRGLGSSDISRLNRPGYACGSLQRLALASKRARPGIPREAAGRIPPNVPTLYNVVEDVSDFAPATAVRKRGIPTWHVLASRLAGAGFGRLIHGQ